MLKEEIRNSVKKHRKEIAEKEKNLLDDIIQEKIINSDLFSNAEKVFVFVSTDEEISTEKIISTALKLNKIVAAPCSDFNIKTMNFVKIESTLELTELNHGIYEPIFDKNKIVIPNKNDICIVPALAFDKRGYRVGYGMGFYDKFLSAFDVISIGVCYSEFLYDTIKSESHDVAVNFLATERDFQKISYSI